jgi:translocation and assembly module TamB
LSIKEKMASPQLGFAINMEEEDKGILGGAVYSKLLEINKDETELNKQVFGLLLFNNFIPANPLEIGGNSSLESSARGSVSDFLSQQLNHLSEEYVKGITIDLNLESYETATSENNTGRTDLQIDLSKKLFNDRLSVKIGGDIPIEGANKNQNFADVAGDFTVEYKLSSDGRYLLKAYRQKEYESTLDGELIETGVSLIYSKDFGSLKDFLRRRKK